MPRNLVVEADGGSRGNPGPGGSGSVIIDADTGEILETISRSLGVCTNNVAEYTGLVLGLEAAYRIDPQAQVEVRMDSKLVVEQMSGRWKIKHPDMQKLAAIARDLIGTRQVRFTWVPRAQNSRADAAANAAMDHPAEYQGPNPLAGDSLF
ncbi:reverse transcriptase-like protein [Gulosibacter sediminis]|uniref:reverse transcriptase-like protein n=1 Tax=Gulosibacter sediminis TaxID=1729695 RepID=UPI0024A93B33|nr:reverse transcriptase-like protein [Gulosibacter sediminis]